jgi:hypothetical protein
LQLRNGNSLSQMEWQSSSPWSIQSHRDILKGKLNPADLPTRGQTVQILTQSEL